MTGLRLARIARMGLLALVLVGLSANEADAKPKCGGQCPPPPVCPEPPPPPACPEPPPPPACVCPTPAAPPKPKVHKHHKKKGPKQCYIPVPCERPAGTTTPQSESPKS